MGLIGAVFLLFIGLISYGSLLPQTFVFERSQPISVQADIIYHEIVDMERIRMWAPFLAGLPLDDTAITGAEQGSGQIIDWRNAVPPFEIGTQHVLAVTPPYFVQSRFASPPYEGGMIYALSESLPRDDVTVLVRLDIDAGRFPFFNRVKLRMKQSAIEDELSRSLMRLETVSGQ